MSSYLTPYNIAIANAQKGFDVANLKHDNYNASLTPLYGGQAQGDAMRDGDFQMEGGDFWSDFADGFMSVMKPVGQVVSAVAPFLGAGESGGRRRRRRGRGLSGGDEVIDTEPALLNADLNSTGMFHPSVAQAGMSLSGAGIRGDSDSDGSSSNDSDSDEDGPTRGGDFWSDLGNVAQQVAPFLPLLGLGKHSSSRDKTRAVARQLMGSGFFDDLIDGIKKVGDVASAVAPHIETGMKIYDKFGKKGKGYSGGKKLSKVQQKLLGEFQALHKAGLTGKGLSGGDFDWSTLASFAPLLLGLGMSGGGEPDMSYAEPFFAGYGLSGGDVFDDLGAGLQKVLSKIEGILDSGLSTADKFLDKIGPTAEKVGKIADTAGKIVNMVSGKRGEGMSGGALSLEQNMNMADAMGDIFSGMGMSGGSLGQRTGMASDTRMKSGKQQLYKGGNIANSGIPPFNKITDAGMSGGDTSVNAPYIGWNEATNSPFARPVGGSSRALVAQQMRPNVNQPYTTGAPRGAGMPAVPMSSAPVNVGGRRCCFNTHAYCNGSKHYNFGTKPKRKSKKGSGQAGNSESIEEIEATDALKNALAVKNPDVNSSEPGASPVEKEMLYASGSGASGGKKRPASKWIEHAKAYAKAHGVSYKQALKDSKATYRGAGQSGGDFWSDLGNVASSVAPFLPLLL